MRQYLPSVASYAVLCYSSIELEAIGQQAKKRGNMRDLRVCGSEGTNWYDESIVTVMGVKYEICDAHYYALEGFWHLKVRKAKA